MERPDIISGTDPRLLSERRGIARLFTYVGSTFALLFAITSLFSGSYYHAVVLLLLAALVIVNLGYLKRSINPVPPIRILALAMAILFLYLMYTGGIHGSGILWFYVFPPLGYFLLGTREGTIAMALVALSSLIIILVLGMPAYLDVYSTSFLQRLVASLAAVSLLSFFYERSRETRYNEIVRLSKALERQAGTDQLSGLLNRFSMTEILEIELERVKRLEKPFSLIMGDIDLFKQINDTQGHLAGDRAIRDVAASIDASIRKQDAAARWGGEEFLIFLPATDKEGAEKTALRIKENLPKLSYLGDRTITMSFGLAYSSHEDRHIDQVIKRADDNLYIAKNGGRDCIVS
ncbi:MAG: diguanylate cyclase [Sedimenticola sp.]